jgi:hypothetical protein
MFLYPNFHFAPHLPNIVCNNNPIDWVGVKRVGGVVRMPARRIQT